jgi:plastocyanin
MLTRRSLLCALLALSAAPARAAGETPAAGRVAGQITIVKTSPTGPAKEDRSGVVVYLDVEQDELALTDDPPVHEIHQLDKAFRPNVSAVVVGTEISFPNDDKIFHNVFSLSKVKRFDLGLYKSGSTKTVLVNRPGIIDVYCNIHPEMWAKIVVVPNKWFYVTGADGKFELKDVPPGTYPVVAWQARGEPARGEVTVTAGGAASLNLTLVETPQSSLHTRKDGTPYGRYQ